MINGVQNNSGAVRAIPDIYPRVCLATGSTATTGSEMNGFTFIALLVIVYCVYKFAFAVIDAWALSIARDQGRRKALEHRALMMRAEKNGEWDANGEWC